MANNNFEGSFDANSPVEQIDTRSKHKELEDSVALCLSGGGYRAMLFHLGALWRLNELGYLKKLARISSVSGGSITSPDATSIQYKAIFTTLDKPSLGTEPYYSETIALEDIHITYLPPAEILYYTSSFF